MKIDICVATYKRPYLLRKLLQSLIRQKVKKDVTISIVVVDNDKEGSSREIVTAAQENSDITIVYDVEPVQNIALARNRSLSHATGDLIAFIDDDEYATEDWLQNLVDCMIQFRADAVFGPVCPILPDETPEWVRVGRFFERPRYATGYLVKLGCTCNALVDARKLGSLDPLFDEAFGLTGGEDADLFERMHQRGDKLVWCDSAIVHEEVHAERISLKYLAMRAFRGGQVHAVRVLKRHDMSYKILWFSYRLSLLFLAIVMTLLLWPLKRHWGIKFLQKVYSNVGQLSVLTHYRFKEYADK